MKRIFLFALMSVLTMGIYAADNMTARKVLDKTAAVVGKKSGALAQFHIANAKLGNASGTIAIKGNKFNARTADATVWFNGKTQWTYMKNTDEVNVTTPTQAQQTQMNPLTFINMYKSGYKLSMKTVEGKYEVRMVAENKSRSVQEMFIVVNPKTFVPTQVRMRQKDSWTTINISNFKATPQSDAVFTFNKKDFPSAEIVDLR
ncbi:MAG: LolA-like putative outer membrane lipoprotein chaperone [Prevotellaceae bacterium]|nr:LolA-like putative outer membrane lipoprotein chaperone [Prevotellaceae bacterium]